MMKISIIGAGKMAYFTATRFLAAGHQILEVYARRISEAEKLAMLTQSKPVADFSDLDENADVFIFALPDDILSQVFVSFPFKNKLLVHCAGTQSLSVFSAENVGLLWPLYSVQKNTSPNQRNIPIFWEAKGDWAEKIVPGLATALSDQTFPTDLKTRQELHLSAVFVNNFVNHLMAITQQRMKQSGIPFSENLRPIIEQTIDFSINGLSAEYQTGPAIRGDEATIKKHLHLLAAHPEWQALYRAISKSIQQFYQ